MMRGTVDRDQRPQNQRGQDGSVPDTGKRGISVENQIFGDAVTGNYSAVVLPAAETGGVNIVELPDRYELIVDLKGAVEDDVLVGVLDHILTVGSKTASEVCNDIGSFLVVDHRERLIEQSFALPADADEDDVCLNFAGGKLKVIIGRKAPPAIGLDSPPAARRES